MYHKGKGVPQDYKTAVKWFTLSAEQGNSNAQYNLALRYKKGEGVPQDYKTAVKWFTLAAEQGDSDAQYSLALMYRDGKGVPQDLIYGHMWLNLSGSNGHEGAGESRDALAKKMTPALIEKAQALARECVRKEYKGC